MSARRKNKGNEESDNSEAPPAKQSRPLSPTEGQSSSRSQGTSQPTTSRQFSIPLERPTTGIDRSYEDYYDLHCVLSAKYGQKGHIIPIVPEKVSSSLMKIKRKYPFQKYLERILKHPELGEDPLVKTFSKREGEYIKTGRKEDDLAVRVEDPGCIENAFSPDEHYPDEFFTDEKLNEFEKLETVLNHLKGEIETFKTNFHAMIMQKMRLDYAVDTYSGQNELEGGSADPWDTLFDSKPTELLDIIEEYLQFLLSLRYAIAERREVIKRGNRREQLESMTQIIQEQVERFQKDRREELKMVVRKYTCYTIQILRQIIDSIEVVTSNETQKIQENDSSPSKTYKVEITGFELCSIQSNHHLMYKLKVEDPTNHSYEIKRSYNHFLDLQYLLFFEHVKTGRLIPIVPPREEGISVDQLEEIGEKQKRLLQQYMDRIMRKESLVTSKVQKFLADGNYTETALSLGDLRNKTTSIDLNEKFPEGKLGEIETNVKDMKEVVELFMESWEKTMEESPEFFEKFAQYFSQDGINFPINFLENCLKVWVRNLVQYSSALADIIEEFFEFFISIRCCLVNRIDTEKLLEDEDKLRLSGVRELSTGCYDELNSKLKSWIDVMKSEVESNTSWHKKEMEKALNAFKKKTVNILRQIVKILEENDQIGPSVINTTTQQQ